MKAAAGLVVLAAAGVLLSACGGGQYVMQTPRYPTRMDQTPSVPAPQYPTTQTPANDAPPYYESETVLPPAPSSSVEASELPPLSGGGSSLPPPPASSGGSSAGGASPLRPGRAYIVQPGDTLSGIARRFGTPVRTLITLNGLPEGGAIGVGARVILPDGVRDNGNDPYATGPSPLQDTVPPTSVTTPSYAPPPPPPPPPSSTTTTPPSSTTTGGSGFPDPAELVRRAGDRFDWPVRGELLTRFGTMGSGLRSDGINIGAPAGTEVRASAAGQVAYAGDSLPGLGTTVVIVHGDGWVTAYSHLGSTNVRMEQRVTQGQVIGTTGTTGGVSQPQVHFEIRYTPSTADRPRPVDPLPLLN